MYLYNIRGIKVHAIWKIVGVGLYLLVTGVSIGWLAGLSTSPVASIIITSIIAAAAAVVTGMGGLKEAQESLPIVLSSSEQPPAAGPAGATQPATIHKTERVRQPFTMSDKFSPLPVMLLVLGLAVGAGVGVWTRAHNKLGAESFTDLRSELDFWEQSGLDRRLVARRLFEQRYSVQGWLKEDLDAELGKWQDATGLKKEEIGVRLFEGAYPTNVDMNNAPAEPASPGPLQEGEAPPVELGILFAVSAAECDTLKFKEGVDLSTEMRSSTDEQINTIATIISDTVILQQLVEEVLCNAG